jgi:predicted AAA+ superfamily ATPase
MIRRPGYLKHLREALRRSPVTALVGPRQCGKTTLARLLANERTSLFDLESPTARRHLQNPEMILGEATGLVILDEIQAMPELYPILRVLVDRPSNRTRFLILGSATPELIRGVSESLAGRVEFVEMGGFDQSEIGSDAWRELWSRGGFPRSYLAGSDEDSFAWREGFMQTFLERDIPNLGITIPAAALRRFWTMLAHLHGRTWNASELGRSMGMSDKTVRSYLDILTGAYMMRQLQPWHQNLGKRQVKAPKIYLRDSGLLHALLAIPDGNTLLAHPSVGASFEGFVVEQVVRLVRPGEVYFWGIHSGAELDLFFLHRGKRIGMEIKFSEAPDLTRSMRTAVESLGLNRLFVICPSPRSYPVEHGIEVVALKDLSKLPDRLAG